MKLHILRHGKAESHSIKDFDRKLHKKGRKQCELLKTYFKERNGIKEIWCSDAFRTRETLHRVSNEHWPKAKFSTSLYLASKDFLLDEIWNNNSSNELLIVGHNFGISDLASYFTEEHIDLGTGEYICIEFQANSWNETSMGLGVIVDRYRPENLH